MKAVLLYVVVGCVLRSCGFMQDFMIRQTISAITIPTASDMPAFKDILRGVSLGFLRNFCAWFIDKSYIIFEIQLFNSAVFSECDRFCISSTEFDSISTENGWYGAASYKGAAPAAVETVSAAKDAARTETILFMTAPPYINSWSSVPIIPTPTEIAAKIAQNLRQLTGSSPTNFPV